MHRFASLQVVRGRLRTSLCTDLLLTAVTPAEIIQAEINTCKHTQVFVSPRFPWFLQFLHRRGVSGGPRAAGDGAELRFCFWHSGQEANEEVVGYTDYELHQPAGGWDPLLWPAHLHQAPRPWKWAVLRPRTLQCHGQLELLVLSDVMNVWHSWWLLGDVCAFFL